jgi:lysyl-tRNA synthetase class 2
LSVQVRELRLLSKALRPCRTSSTAWQTRNQIPPALRGPDRLAGDAQHVPRRTQAISSIRRHMADAGFMEVETPMLHPIPGGAAAKPFITHHNALDMQMFCASRPSCI